jgi:hypothetical protein
MNIFAFTQDRFIRFVPPRKYASGLAIAVFLATLLYGFNVLAQVSNIVFFSVGKGYTDGIPRQLVRTNSDHLYIFTPNAQHTNTINVFWTAGTGLPANAAAFTAQTPLTEVANPLSVDAVYDGGTTIHLLINTKNGLVNDHPFDTVTNTFRPVIPLATNGASMTGNYIGTVGVSGMVATNGVLHMAYWSNNDQIIHRAYTYNAGTNTLTLSGSEFRVDTNGSANHPAVAVSPVDNSVTVAWVSETATKQILARTRSSGGTWGAVETVSGPGVVPWTSRNEGVNIDQGPNMLITPNGTRHLLYIENWDTTNQYGHVHYAMNSGSGWTDEALNLYSHNPGLATNYIGDIYLIGHGAVNGAHENENMYTMKKNSNGTWGTPQIFAEPPDGESFDASPSIKWSVVGFNRPETVEFAFFTPVNLNYNETNIYYGRFDIGGGAPPATQPPVTPTSPPNSTPARHFFAVRQPTLTWTPITWALGYQIQIDDDPNFGSPIGEPDELSATTLSYTTVGALANGRYYWRVRAKKNATQWGGWSAKETFIISAA